MSNPDENRIRPKVDEAFELVNLEAASALTHAGKGGLVSCWAGLYDVTPDAHPIFGSTPVKVSCSNGFLRTRFHAWSGSWFTNGRADL
jgi:glycine/D-amino acid oxidase-like deaminating enzyme